jgi:hypothetical protein
MEELDGAHEIVPVCRIVDEGAQAVAPLGQEFVETSGALGGALIGDGFQPPLGEKTHRRQGADEDQHKENQKE